jgi:hypothetical protein
MRNALIVVVFAAACGNSVSITDFAAKYIDATCKYDVACQLMPDTATCKAALFIDDNYYETIVALVKAGTIKYSGDEAGSCIDQQASLTCSYTGFRPDPNDPCTKIFTGTVAAGGACLVSEECAGAGATCPQTDPMCDPTTACCPGTCMAAAAKLPLGGNCGSSAQCADNAYCSDKTNQCTAVVTTSGGACEGLDGCANPMFCNEDLQSFTGTCMTAVASNATCDATTLIPCSDVRDYCNLMTTKCTRNSPVGAVCDSTTPQTTGTLCVGYAECNNSTCVAHPKAGATCDAMNGPTCLGDLGCTNSVCTLPPKGTSCK